MIGALGGNDEPSTVLSLGDSFSCGEGVGVRLDIRRTWAGLLAGAIGAHHDVLAVAGATTRQVRDGQLPVALRREPSWVTLLVGLNDAFRPGFDADATGADLRAMVAELRVRHHGVLVVRLHDPGAILPIPQQVRRALRNRTAAVNDAVESCAGPDVVIMDLAAIDVLRRRVAWAVDRLHPSEYGHAAIAAAAATAIAGPESLWPAAIVPLSVEAPAPTRLAECRWVARHGVPWVARRAGMVGSVLRTMLTDMDEASVHAH